MTTIICHKCGKEAKIVGAEPHAAVCMNLKCSAYNSFWTIGTPGYHERFEEV